MINLLISTKANYQPQSTMIQELFGGRVAEFLKYDMLFLGEELTGILNQQFNRLSQLEKSVISHVASQSKAIGISELLEDMRLAPSELVNAMQSLGRRSLIETKA